MKTSCNEVFIFLRFNEQLNEHFIKHVICHTGVTFFIQELRAKTSISQLSIAWKNSSLQIIKWCILLCNANPFSPPNLLPE